MKNIFVHILLFLSLVISAHSQVYVQSNWYMPTKGSELVLNIGTGKANDGGIIITYAGGTLTMTANTTNYVYLNTSAAYAPATKTSAFTSSDVPIAIVVAENSTITSVTDVRTPYTQSARAAGGSGDSKYIVAGSTVAFAGDSLMEDDGHYYSSAITVTAVNCNGTKCSVTNSGVNGLVAGGHVYTGTITSPSFLNVASGWVSDVNLMKVSATGLSDTTFEFAYTANTGTGTGGIAYNADPYPVYQIVKQPAFANAANVYVNQSMPYSLATVAENGAGLYATTFHLQSPAVTGKPGYLILPSDENIFFLHFAGGPDGPVACTLAGYKQWYQSVWTQAHADGWKVVQSTDKPFQGSAFACTNAFTMWAQLQEWLRAQGGVSATGANWDKLIESGRLFYDDYPSNVSPWVSSLIGYGGQSEAYTPGGIGYLANYYNSAMTSGGSQETPLSTCFVFNDCAQLSESNTFTGLYGQKFYYSIEIIDRFSHTLGYTLADNTTEMAESIYGVHLSSKYVYASHPYHRWVSDAVLSIGTDVGLSRESAGVLDCGNGLFNDTSCTIKAASILPGVLYSAAGTPLPACAAGLNGQKSTVSDATSPVLYMTAYASGGAITADVICSYDGSTYAWLMH